MTSGVANNDGIADGAGVVGNIDVDDGDGSDVRDDVKVEVGDDVKVEVEVGDNVGVGDVIVVDIGVDEDVAGNEDKDVGDCVNCDDDNVGEADAGNAGDEARDGSSDCDDPVGD